MGDVDFSKTVDRPGVGAQLFLGSVLGLQTRFDVLDRCRDGAYGPAGEEACKPVHHGREGPLRGRFGGLNGARQKVSVEG